MDPQIEQKSVIILFLQTKETEIPAKPITHNGNAFKKNSNGVGLNGNSATTITETPPEIEKPVEVKAERPERRIGFRCML